MSQYVVLEMRTMDVPISFHTTQSTARELFEKIKRCHEEPARHFFIETELPDGALFLVAVIPQHILTMATYPAESPNKELVDVLKKQIGEGEEWRGDAEDD